MASPHGATWSTSRITLFGGFVIRSHEQVKKLPLGAQRLVAYLALERRPVTRSHLAERLWPDSRRRQAAANLRTALWRVRQLMDEGVVRAEPYGLALADAVGVDLHDVADEARMLVDAANDHDVDGIAVTAETVSRLSARLLPGWYDDWVLLEQERWDQLRLHALEAVAELLTCRGQHMLALEASLLAARSELFRESAHRAVIRVYIAEGNCGAALQHYHEYRRMLHRELNIAPTATMLDLMHPLITPHTPS